MYTIYSIEGGYAFQYITEEELMRAEEELRLREALEQQGFEFVPYGP